ncbi:hypothetical protein D9M69_471040 [compost metagenome]
MLHRLAQTFALQRVEVGQGGTGHRLGGHIEQAKAARAAAALMGQHGHAFRGAVVFHAAAQVDAAGGGHLALGLEHLDACHGHPIQLDCLGLYAQRWRGARCDHASQALQQTMLGMQAGGRAVILDTQPQLAPLGVGQADQRLDQLAVGELAAVAFEFDGERFAGR